MAELTYFRAGRHQAGLTYSGAPPEVTDYWVQGLAEADFDGDRLSRNDTEDTRKTRTPSSRTFLTEHTDEDGVKSLKLKKPVTIRHN